MISMDAVVHSSPSHDRQSKITDLVGDYLIVLGALRCYLGLTHASSIPRMLELHRVFTGTYGQFISEATVKKEQSLRMISEQFNMPNTAFVIS